MTTSSRNFTGNWNCFIKTHKMEEQIFRQRTDLAELNEAVQLLREQIKKIIVGQDEMVKLIIVALLADGHVLIEGVPGVAKTLTAKLVAKSLSVHFVRLHERALH